MTEVSVEEVDRLFADVVLVLLPNASNGIAGTGGIFSPEIEPPVKELEETFRDEIAVADDPIDMFDAVDEVEVDVEDATKAEREIGLGNGRPKSCFSLPSDSLFFSLSLSRKCSGKGGTGGGGGSVLVME